MQKFLGGVGQMLYTRDAFGVNGDGCNEGSYTWFLVEVIQKEQSTQQSILPPFHRKRKYAI